jgi:hypothetical protein
MPRPIYCTIRASSSGSQKAAFLGSAEFFDLTGSSFPDATPTD